MRACTALRCHLAQNERAVQIEERKEAIWGVWGFTVTPTFKILLKHSVGKNG